MVSFLNDKCMLRSLCESKGCVFDCCGRFDFDPLRIASLSNLDFVIQNFNFLFFGLKKKKQKGISTQLPHGHSNSCK